jgi:phospholipid/cholesterol/gamma-HCH transport system substrate-binding protein
MERNANYALVGISALLLFMGTLIFVVWLARFQFAHVYDQYDVLFVGPVRGLNDGGEVHFNGIKVGDVTKIGLDNTNSNRVIARIRITSDVPIRTDSRASLEPQGITGVNYIQISAGAQNSPLMTPAARDEVPVILSQSNALSDLLAGGGTVLTRTIEALDRFDRVLSDDNINNLTVTVKDLRSITTVLNEHRSVIEDGQLALLNISNATKDADILINNLNGTLNGDGKTALRNLSEASNAIKDTAQSTQRLIDKLDGPAGDFATTGMPQLSAAIVTLQDAAASLDRMANAFERDPRGIISKAPAKQVEVKP